MTDIYDMSDEELEQAFRAAKEELSAAGETTYQENFEDDNQEQALQTTDFDDNSEDKDTGTASDKDTDTTSDENNYEDNNQTTDGTVAEGEDPADTETVEETASTEDKSIAAPVVHKFKANGKEYEITDDEMRQQFPKIFGQAMNYTQKMQTLSPWRKTIDAMEQAKIKHEDVNLLIDVLKGDKAALASVIKKVGVDTLDIDLEEGDTYQAKEYGRDTKVLDLQDVINSINTDPEYAVTHKIISSEWDDASWNVLSNDPEKVRLLHVDVKNGTYAKLQPIAEKLRVFDGARRSDLDYYLQAASEYFTREEQTRFQQQQTELQAREEALKVQSRTVAATQQQNQRNATVQAANKRKAAAPTGRGVSKPSTINYLDTSDEAFEEWYKKLEES